MPVTKIVSLENSGYLLGKEQIHLCPVKKMSIMLHHFDLHQQHGVSAFSLLLLRWFTSHPYVMPLLYFAMQRYTTCSLLIIPAILLTKIL